MVKDVCRSGVWRYESQRGRARGINLDLNTRLSAVLGLPSECPLRSVSSKSWIPRVYSNNPLGTQAFWKMIHRRPASRKQYSYVGLMSASSADPSLFWGQIAAGR